MGATVSNWCFWSILPSEKKVGVTQTSLFLSRIPYELQEMVFANLNLGDLARTMLVCKRFSKIAEKKALLHIFPAIITGVLGNHRAAKMPRIRPCNFDITENSVIELTPLMKKRVFAWGRDKKGRYFLAVHYLSKRRHGLLLLHQMSPPSSAKLSEIKWMAKDTLSDFNELKGNEFYRYWAGHRFPKCFNKVNDSEFQTFVRSFSIISPADTGKKIV